MMDKTMRIAVVGGGISGLAAAERLQRKGYEHVTVFEKGERLGGKLCTVSYKGESYEMGALFSLPGQTHLRNLMNILQIKTDGPRTSRIYCDAEGKRKMQIPKDRLGNFIEELDRLPEVLATYPSLGQPLIGDIEEALMLPFSDWCEINAFQVLQEIYAHYFTSYGLGYVEDMPAVYVLRVLNFGNLMSFMDLPELLSWQEGVVTVVKELEARIDDIRFSQPIQKIVANGTGAVRVLTKMESLDYDRVILAAPLEQFPGLFSGDSKMERQVKNIQYHQFSVYAFVVDDSPKECGCILENLKRENRGHMGVWYSRWAEVEGEKLLMAYAYDNPVHTAKKSLETVKGDLAQLGVENPRLYCVKRWNQCPHVSTEIIQSGFYRKLEAMQGKNGVYFAGEIMSAISMDNSVGAINELVERYF